MQSASKACFVSGFKLTLGGNVSAGASAYWYYRLTPADYVTGNIAPNAYYDRAFLDGKYARFSVS